jgi:hypothetical protein
MYVYNLLHEQNDVRGRSTIIIFKSKILLTQQVVASSKNGIKYEIFTPMRRALKTTTMTADGQATSFGSYKNIQDSHTLNQRKTINQQNHKPNTCMATAR